MTVRPENGLKRIGASARILRPALVAMLLQDGLGKRPRPEASERHLDATVDWLCRAHDACGRRGLSAGFSLVHGWLPPFPEAAGLAIRTLFDYAELSGRNDLHERAVQLADWEIEAQLPTGAVQGGLTDGDDARPSAFATGTVIRAWCQSYVATCNERHVTAARIAGNWLIAEQAPDGSWPLRTKTPRACDARAAYALLELAAVTGDRRYERAGRRAITWALSRRREDDWLDTGTLPLTEVATTLDAFLCAYPFVEDGDCLGAARRGGERLLDLLKSMGHLPAEIGDGWQPRARSRSVAGDAQSAAFFHRLYLATADAKFLRAGVDLDHGVKARHSLTSSHAGVRGGVKGSQPVFARFARYTFPSAGAAVFADALMLEAAALRRRGIVMGE